MNTEQTTSEGRATFDAEVIESTRRGLCEVAEKLRDATTGAAALTLFAEMAGVLAMTEFGSALLAAEYLRQVASRIEGGDQPVTMH